PEAAAVGLVAQGAHRAILAVERRHAEGRLQLAVVHALDLAHRDGTAGIGRTEDALLAAGQGILRSAAVRNAAAQEESGGERRKGRFHADDLNRSTGGLKGQRRFDGGLSVCATCTIAAVPSTGTIRLRIGMVPRKTMTMPVSHSTPPLARRHALTSDGSRRRSATCS